MKKSVIAAAVAALGFVGTAGAADMPVKAPMAPIAAPFSWTGWYIGVNVGGGWGSQSVNYAPNDLLATTILNSINGPPPTSFRTSGVIGGLQLGYNWQVAPTWLIGAEADFGWSNIKGTGTSSATSILLAAPFSNTVEEKVKWLGTVRARLGYLPMPNLLAFITGGFAYGQVEHNGAATTGGVAIVQGGAGATCTANVPCFTGSTSTTATGWAAGGGLEYAFAPKWTLRGEYLYVRLAGKSVTETAVATGGGTTPASFTASFGRTNLNIARAALNYRF